jgi:ribosomal protein S8
MNFSIVKFISNLKVASISNKKVMYIKKNVLILKYLKLLYIEGYILSYKTTEENIVVFLRYSNNRCLTENIKLISKPSKDIYLKYNDIVLLNLKNKDLFLSTTKGFLSLKDAKKYRKGGLALFSC